MIIVGLNFAILSDDSELEQNVVSLTKAELDLAYLRRAGVAAADLETLMELDAVAIRRLERSLRGKLATVNQEHREQIITMLLDRDVQMVTQVHGANDVTPLAMLANAAIADAACA